MTKIDLYNTKGKKKGQVDLPAQIFAAPINEPLMAQAVRVYLSNQRRAKAKTRTRGQVRGSGRKIWPQKGTGRARHGDRYAPIFVGGGIAHGPRGNQNYQLKMPQKMRRAALFSALTGKLKKKQILVIEGLAKIKPKTKEMAKIMENLKCSMENGKLKEKILLVLPEKIENVIRAGKNLANLKMMPANLLNTYQVLKGGRLVLMKESLPRLEKTFLKEGK